MQEQLKSDNIQFGIVGLGLIGGSIAKSLKVNNFDVYADDANASNISIALEDKVILGNLDKLDPSKAFVLIFGHCSWIGIHACAVREFHDVLGIPNALIWIFSEIKSVHFAHDER